MRLYLLLEIIENYKKNLEKKSEKSGKSLKKSESPGKNPWTFESQKVSYTFVQVIHPSILKT